MSRIKRHLQELDDQTIEGVNERLSKSLEVINTHMSILKRFSETKDLCEYLESVQSVLRDNSLKENIPDIKNKSVVKEERISNVSNKPIEEKRITRSNSNIMQAPTKLAPRKKKIKEEPVEASLRVKRTKRKHTEQNEEREPSILVIEHKFSTVDLTIDGGNCAPKELNTTYLKSSTSKMEEGPVRITRTKTRLQKKKDIEEAKSGSEDKDVNATYLLSNENENAKEKSSLLSNNNENPKEKSNLLSKKSKDAKNKKNIESPPKEVNKSNQTEYEDAISDSFEGGESGNSTLKNKKDSSTEKNTNGFKTPLKNKTVTNLIFSPYENCSIKKKVEAFEKLGSATKNISKLPIKNPPSSSKTKYLTPFASKFEPKTCSTTLVNKNPSDCLPKTPISVNTPLKCTSILKSQDEFRERERKRKEKETEAQIKKVALLKAQAEEKRKKREEKQVKAQQQRELIIQKEKEKQNELIKLKEEKHKQAIAEKQDKLKKSREQSEKIRAMVKNKAKLIKKDLRGNEEKRQELPIYMTTKLPQLATKDCYDSDDENYRPVEKPDWGRGTNLNKQLYVQLIAGEKIMNTLFSSEIQSPDLLEIFEVIDPKKLKRTSSAQWKKPPRYTLFSTTSEIIFSEDSE